jgi:hypothetical protein
MIGKLIEATKVKRTLAALAAVAGIFGAMTVAETPALAQGLDIDKVFWCTEGNIGDQSVDQCTASRDLILNNCTACHTIVPIVKAQKDEAGWNATLQVHRTRVPEVSDADYEQLGKFLTAHFNPENPVPELPPELEGLGNNQAF